MSEIELGRNEEICPDCGNVANNYEFSEVTDLDCDHCGLHMIYDYYDHTAYVYQSAVAKSAMSELMVMG